MEEKDRISGSLEEVNGFRYLKKGKEKYFIGDFVEIHDTSLNSSEKPFKYEIVDILKNGSNGIVIQTFNQNQGANLYGSERVKSFYYKKDIKKYVHRATPRIFEAKPDELVVDTLGNKGYLKDMILINKKLIVKSVCTKIHLNNNEKNDLWVLTSDLGKINYFKCPYDGELYHGDYGTTAYVAKHISGNSFEVKGVVVNRGAKDKIITCNIRILNSSYSSEVCAILNGEELLKSHPDLFAIGPRSGQLILKSKIKSDGYRQYDNGYYFPEFKSLQKFKEGNNEHNFKWGLDSPTHLITEGLKYTFGVEIEMADCTFTPSMMRDYNIMVEKDGSIRNSRGEKYGPEIITGVLKGDHGFAHLQALCNELASKGEVNHTCGIHAHVGSADFNNTNIVLLFKLLKHLEDEVFNMLPRSRRDNEYCRKLPNLDFNFDGCNTIMDMKIRVDNYYTELFTKAANSPPSDKLNKMVNHPKGAKVGYDHSNIRYCWTNFIPALFNTRNTKPPTYTIEFRCFNASTNFTKIKNWVKICMGLVNFAENHHSDIMSNTVTLQGQVLPLTLKNVMNKVYPKSYRILNEFIDMRTELFKDVELEDTKNENEVSVNLKLKELI